MEQSIKQTLGLGKNKIIHLIKGMILGIGIIIPGVSGGTIIMAFGMYEVILEDLLKVRIKPYILFGLGTLMGIFLGSVVIGHLLEFYQNTTLAFILACLLMSIPMILKKSKDYSFTNIILLVLGSILAYVLIHLPAMSQGGPLSIQETFLAGFIASGTMIIPGVSGSGVLIIMGIYEEVLLMLNGLQWKSLFVFILGALVGIGILAKVLKMVFNKHGSKILFLFSGLILGSSPMLFPQTFDIPSIFSFLIGGALVYKFGNT